MKIFPPVALFLLFPAGFCLRVAPHVCSSVSGWYVQYSDPLQPKVLCPMCPPCRIKLFRKFSIKLKTLMNVETWREGPSLSCRVIPSHWRTTSSDKNHETFKVTSKRTSWHFRQRTKHVFLWFCFPLFASLSNGKRSWIFRFSEGSSRKSILFLLTMICRFSWRFRQLFEKVSLVAYSKYLTMIFFIT